MGFQKNEGRDLGLSLLGGLHHKTHRNEGYIGVLHVGGNSQSMEPHPGSLLNRLQRLEIG